MPSKNFGRSMFADREGAVLIVGNSRSGTTIVGAIINAHPQMMCANESKASRRLWRGYDGPKLLGELKSNVEWNERRGRHSSGYDYSIDQPPLETKNVRVIGDKIRNPVLLNLHGSPKIVADIERILECPLYVVHVLRHPADVVATMHRRSSLSLLDRVRWCFMHHDAALSLKTRMPTERWLDIHLEELIDSPITVIEHIVNFLGVTRDDAYFGSCARALLNSPRRTRQSVEWPHDAQEELTQRLVKYDFLSRYLPD